MDNQDGAGHEANEVAAASELVPAASEDSSSSAVDWLEAIAEIAIDVLFAWW